MNGQGMLEEMRAPDFSRILAEPVRTTMLWCPRGGGRRARKGLPETDNRADLRECATMTDQSSTATRKNAEDFVDVCQWTYECWVTCANFLESLPEYLFQECGISKQDLLGTSHGRCLHRLHVIGHEYILLQISKLHDPHKQGQNENLSISFFTKQECWIEEEKAEIDKIVSELDRFHQCIGPARNKIIAHNDRSTFSKNEAPGRFEEGDDEKYFKVLARLCSMIWDKFCKSGGPYPNRVFNFTKSGLQDQYDPGCEASELRKLVVGQICKLVAS